MPSPTDTRPAGPEPATSGGGVPISRRLLARDRIRFLVTSGAVGAAVALVLFLFGGVAGIEREANGYVESRPVDLWVSHVNSNNLLRSSSYMLNTIGGALDTIPGIASTTPLLRAIARTETGGESTSFFVLGIEPGRDETRPTVVEGSGEVGPGELIVDRAFARSHGLEVGQAIRIQAKVFRIVGLSIGSNAVITQFAFASLADTEMLLGFEDIVSFYLVRLEPDATVADVAAEVTALTPELHAIGQEAFTENNRRELRSGVTAVLWSMAIFGAIVGSVVLSLLLYVGVVERRVDYAYFLAVGAPRRWIDGIVVRQAVLTVLAGLAAGGVVFGAAVPVFYLLVPQSAFWVTPEMILGTSVAALALGVLAAMVPLRHLRTIDPGEVFRP